MGEGREEGGTEGVGKQGEEGERKWRGRERWREEEGKREEMRDLPFAKDWVYIMEKPGARYCI